VIEGAGMEGVEGLDTGGVEEGGVDTGGVEEEVEDVEEIEVEEVEVEEVEVEEVEVEEVEGVFDSRGVERGMTFFVSGLRDTPYFFSAKSFFSSGFSPDPPRT
jgi:hypothetical protein